MMAQGECDPRTQTATRGEERALQASGCEVLQLSNHMMEKVFYIKVGVSQTNDKLARH